MSYVYILSGQKLIKNAKIQKCECDILSIFQTMCGGGMLQMRPFWVIFKHCEVVQCKKILTFLPFMILGPKQGHDRI